MTDIQYCTGDATAPIGEGPKIIAHVCNDMGGWGKGFVVAISRRWSEPEAAYRKWYADKEPTFELGAIQVVPVEDGLWVANMIGQRGLRKGPDGPPIRYAAIRECLGKLAKEAKQHDASVHMPRIGCGLAGGQWEEIEPLIAETLLDAGVKVTVYDFA
jgi:O-acetyl-ADP-ribose deacetylase (regulator of RNase III)